MALRLLASGNYEIISGNQRFEAAKRAKVKDVPCFVVEMTDEEAFRELLLSNAQLDLASLEVGMHVLLLSLRGSILFFALHPVQPLARL